MADQAIAARSRPLHIAIPLAALGLAALAFGPLPLAMLGAVAFLASVSLRPWLATPLVVLTLPFYLHPRVFGGIEVSLTEVTILSSTAGVLLRAVTERLPTALRIPSQRWAKVNRDSKVADQPSPAGGELKAPSGSPVDWAVVTVLLGALLSLLVTEYPRQSLRELRWLIVEPLLFFYVARATLRPELVAVVLWSVVASGLIASLVGLGSLVVSGTLLDPAARATHPYLSPNHLGLFLGRTGAVALAMALFAQRTNRPSRLGSSAWVALGVSAAGLTRTLSLGAWAGLAASALALAALRGRGWLSAAALALVLAFLVGVVVLPAGRISGRLDPTTGTALFRVQIWTSSVRMIADHPLLGVGLDNFLYLYRGHYMLPEAAEEPNISHPHNWLLHFWLELGLLGVAAAVGLLIWAGKTALALVREPSRPEDRLVGAAAVGVFADTLVHGSLDNSYFVVDAAVLWWLFIALLVVQVQHRQMDPREGPAE